MDNIFQISLRDFKINTIIGILEFERKNKQNIIIDIDILYRNIEILDYSLIHSLIIDIFNKNQFYYIEDALDFVLDSIKSNFKYLISIDISIKKLNIFDDCIASVSKKINLENLL
ncbi:dihydroneopterin aldolase [Helicobacter sp. MIT 99-5507]|uniref:dihydroneopterin aldolase n=1 Tax=Helicobacter sp. MIT 99-5507 TaxID=152489 RepID=UPI0015F1ADAF|nr:dihydroneopterin aldolase [Helicobacter sp. MIT 99-5507]